MTLHIVMPSYRWWHLLNIKANIEWAVTDLSKVTWNIIVFESLYRNFPEHLAVNLRAPWINIVRADEATPGTDACYCKINRYFEQGVKPRDKYYIVCDDDMVLKGIDKVAEAMTSEILVVSMKRGTRPGRHPNSTLIAHPANRRVGCIGLGMFIVSGVVMQHRRFEEGNPCADGKFIIDATAAFETEYDPDTYALFNACTDLWDPADLRRAADNADQATRSA
jgi:hypothetical protein